MAIAVLVAIARQNSDKSPSPPPARTPVSATMDPAPSAPPSDPSDVQLEVREILVADGGADRTSIRIEHPDPGVQSRLREFLDPREQAALAKNTALDCHAQIAKTSLISLTCVTLVPASADAGVNAGDGGAATEPHYESLTLRFVRGQVKALALADVLRPDAGQNEVIAGCKSAAEPDLACEWPPTDFSISPGGTLFICHGAHCIDIDQADAPNLLRPEFR